MDAQILFTKYSWIALQMERGARYNRGLSKQVMISVSHYQSPCNEKEIGIEKACHEFKVCYFFKNTIWSKKISLFFYSRLSNHLNKNLHVDYHG